MFPSVAVDDKGVIYIAFIDHRDNQDKPTVDVYLAASSDGGKTFSKNLRVNDLSIPIGQGGRVIGDYLDMVSAGESRIFVAYPCVGLSGWVSSNTPSDACVTTVLKSIPSEPPIAEASVKSLEGDNYFNSIVISTNPQSLSLNVDKDINGNGLASYDPDGSSDLIGGFCAWDFNMPSRSDEALTFVPDTIKLIQTGITDCNTEVDSSQYYSKPGKYHPTVRVVDRNQKVSNLSSVTIEVFSAFDYNNDNFLSISDSYYLTNIFLGKTVCPALKNCDVNGDGGIATISDVQSYVNMLLRLYNYNNDKTLNSDDTYYLIDVHIGKVACPESRNCDVDDNGHAAAYPDVLAHHKNIIFSQFDYNNDNAVDTSDTYYLVDVFSGKFGCPLDKNCDIDRDGNIATISDVQAHYNKTLEYSDVLRRFNEILSGVIAS